MDSKPGRAGKVAGVVLVVAAVVVVSVLTRRLVTADLPDLPMPDLPDWLGPVLKWGKLVVLVLISALAVVGELERRRRRDRSAGGEDVRSGGS